MNKERKKEVVLYAAVLQNQDTGDAAEVAFGIACLNIFTHIYIQILH